MAEQVEVKKKCPTDRGLSYLCVASVKSFGKNRVITGQREFLPYRQRSCFYRLFHSLTIEKDKKKKNTDWDS